MDRANGSVTEAARLAGVSRQFVQRMLKKHGLRVAIRDPSPNGEGVANDGRGTGRTESGPER